MSVTLYDDALMKKFTSLLKDNRIKILAPEETTEYFQQLLAEQKDKPITLPLVTLTRSSTINLINPHKSMMTYDGFMIGSTVDTSIQVDAVPMELTYDIDIYAKEFKQVDAYIRNLVFDLIVHPNVKIVLPYNDANLEMWSHIRLLPAIEDRSSIPNRIVHDQFKRWSITFTIDDAYFYSLPYKKNVSIGETILDCGCEGNLG